MSRRAPWLLAFVLLASPVLATPPDGTAVRELIIAAARAHGVEVAPQLSVNRGFPSCNEALTIAPVDGNWASVTLACPDKMGWRRVIRTYSPTVPALRATSTNDWLLSTTALVLTESLSRGTILQAAHLTPTEVSATGHTDLIQNPANAIGRSLRSNLGAGQPLLGRHLNPDSAVRRDRPVSITIAAEPILIETTGVALEDGQLGQDIRVRNTSSDRVLHVTVTGPNKVTVQPNMR